MFLASLGICAGDCEACQLPHSPMLIRRRSKGGMLMSSFTWRVDARMRNEAKPLCRWRQMKLLIRLAENQKWQTRLRLFGILFAFLRLDKADIIMYEICDVHGSATYLSGVIVHDNMPMCRRDCEACQWPHPPMVMRLRCKLVMLMSAPTRHVNARVRKIYRPCNGGDEWDCIWTHRIWFECVGCIGSHENVAFLLLALLGMIMCQCAEEIARLVNDLIRPWQWG